MYLYPFYSILEEYSEKIQCKDIACDARHVRESLHRLHSRIFNRFGPFNDGHLFGSITCGITDFDPIQGEEKITFQIKLDDPKSRETERVITSSECPISIESLDR
jgi:hypothetical protein